jgi:O-acetylhomoserine/O-acetylserine sulfhydrylase-like pyridoxal-dependent enzyme
MHKVENSAFKSALSLSPVRKSSTAKDLDGLVAEQLQHFQIDPDSEFGQHLAKLVASLLQSQGSVDELWQVAQRHMHELTHEDRIMLFNAKKFLSFQIAKILDTLQTDFRQSYQQLDDSLVTQAARSAYPVIDNVSALFSATPVIARTATYTFACADWIADAFEGKEFMLPIYSRLLNPTSIALANHIVDLECGNLANQYMAWNFNSGMAAIDGTLSHVLGYQDILIASRNLYGGVYQLLHDWYAKSSNLDIAVEQYDGFGAEDFLACLHEVKTKYAERLGQGKQIYLHIESPCNPHGYVLDVPALCKAAHQQGIRVILDATIGTPFLIRPLRRDDPQERPDFLIHSFTKDLSGTGAVLGGCVIAHNEDMFIPKGQPGWDNTMFWNVYYIKGAFLSADSAYEIMQGMRTLSLRMLHKCINTDIFARFLDSHPDIRVNCNALSANSNSGLRHKLVALGLPAPLFTFDLGNIPTACFRQFFDNLEPAFAHQISLGQTNTTVSCPGLTTHSELREAEQQKCGIFPATIRIAIGCENPIDLIRHFAAAARVIIDPVVPGFSTGLMPTGEVETLIRETYMKYHQGYIDSCLG